MDGPVCFVNITGDSRFFIGTVGGGAVPARSDLVLPTIREEGKSTFPVSCLLVVKESVDTNAGASFALGGVDSNVQIPFGPTRFGTTMAT